MLEEARLVAEALRGNTRAFAGIYDLHVDAVYLQALEQLQNEDDAQEVTQEVFATAWRRLDRVRMVNGSARSWLLVTCRNLTANRLRSQRRRPVTADIEDAAPTLTETDIVDERFDRHRLLDRVEDEVAQMNPTDRQVYRGVLHEGRSYDEVASSLGISTASVGKRLNRVRQRLRGTFEGEQ